MRYHLQNSKLPEGNSSINSRDYSKSFQKRPFQINESKGFADRCPIPHPVKKCTNQWCRGNYDDKVSIFFARTLVIWIGKITRLDGEKNMILEFEKLVFGWENKEFFRTIPFRFSFSPFDF